MVVKPTLYVHYIIFCKAIQELFAFSHPNHAEGVYMINSAGIAYNQHEVLYIIKPQARCTLARDEIHGVAVMISSPAGADDMPSLRLG